MQGDVRVEHGRGDPSAPVGVGRPGSRGRPGRRRPRRARACRRSATARASSEPGRDGAGRAGRAPRARGTTRPGPCSSSSTTFTTTRVPSASVPRQISLSRSTRMQPVIVAGPTTSPIRCRSCRDCAGAVPSATRMSVRVRATRTPNASSSVASGSVPTCGAVREDRVDQRRRLPEVLEQGHRVARDQLGRDAAAAARDEHLVLVRHRHGLDVGVQEVAAPRGRSCRDPGAGAPGHDVVRRPRARPAPSRRRLSCRDVRTQARAVLVERCGDGAAQHGAPALPAPRPGRGTRCRWRRPAR